MNIYAISSGKKTASALIYTGRARIVGVDIVPGGADISVVIYDNTAASGTEVFLGKGIANNASTTYVVDVEVENGIYLSISGSGDVVVRYRPI